MTGCLIPAGHAKQLRMRQALYDYLDRIWGNLGVSWSVDRMVAGSGGVGGWSVVPELPTPWQDTISAERVGWRQRAANLGGEFAFAVDYQVCRRSRLGWVEQPYTLPRLQNPNLRKDWGPVVDMPAGWPADSGLVTLTATVAVAGWAADQYGGPLWSSSPRCSGPRHHQPGRRKGWPGHDHYPGGDRPGWALQCRA